MFLKKVQSMRWDGESLCSWSGAFMPSEGKFLSFIFLCARVGNNQNFFFFLVQIKLKLILKLTGNGLVMRSHNTVAISPKRVQVMTLNMWAWSITEKWGSSDCPCPVASNAATVLWKWFSWCERTHYADNRTL